MGLCGVREMTLTREAVAALVLEKLQKLGEACALVAELGEGVNASAGTLLIALNLLRDRGLISSHPHPSRYATNRLRWYVAEHRPAQGPVVQLVEPGFTKKRGPVTLQVSDSQQVDASRAKVTQCPGYTHNHRYQVAPGAAVVGAGFAALGVGRYLGSEARG